MRQDDKIKIGQVNAACFHVVGKNVAIIPRVEQNALAGNFHQCGEAPILLHCGVFAKGIVQNRNPLTGIGSESSSTRLNDGRSRECTGKKQCCMEFHVTPPWSLGTRPCLMCNSQTYKTTTPETGVGATYVGANSQARLRGSQPNAMPVRFVRGLELRN